MMYNFVINFIENILGDTNEIKIENLHSVSKGEGGTSEVLFVGASDKNETHYFVVKCGRKCESVRSQELIRDAFSKEIYFYTHIFTTFENIQLEIKMNNPFKCVPRLWGFDTEKEIIILEDLRAGGYYPWNKRIPFNRAHCEVIMKEYGKFHGLSYILRIRNGPLFEKLASNKLNVMKNFCHLRKFTEVISMALNEMCDKVPIDILDNVKNLVHDIPYILFELDTPDDPYAVILHGDSCPTNFMFKYEDSSRVNPTELVFLDFQFTRMASPIIDLSSFFYCDNDEENLKDFDHFMKIYYESLCNILEEFGCKEQVYSYEIFINQWKIYARYGFLISLYLLKLCPCDEDEPSDQTIEDNCNFEIRNRNEYERRVLIIIEHMAKRKFI